MECQLGLTEFFQLGSSSDCFCGTRVGLGFPTSDFVPETETDAATFSAGRFKSFSKQTAWMILPAESMKETFFIPVIFELDTSSSEPALNQPSGVSGEFRSYAWTLVWQVIRTESGDAAEAGGGFGALTVSVDSGFVVDGAAGLDFMYFSFTTNAA